MSLSGFLTFLAVWTALSCIGGIAFCWLIKRGFIRFAPIEDRNEYSRNWEPRS